MKFMMRPLTTNTKPISNCRINRLFRYVSRAIAEEPGELSRPLFIHYNQPERGWKQMMQIVRMI